MKLYGKGRVEKFKKKHPTSRQRLSDWISAVEKAEWENLIDIQANYSNKVEYVPNKDCYVFDIGGNTFRLITKIAFSLETVLVVDILTHAEYDRWCL